MEITPLIKDKVLNYLCQADFEKNVYTPLATTLQDLEISFDELNAILNQFERLGFISNLNLRRNADKFWLVIHIDAGDFKDRGGFFVQEATLKLTLEKLALEVDSLSKEFPDKAVTFTTIAANIATCLSFINVSIK